MDFDDAMSIVCLYISCLMISIFLLDAIRIVEKSALREDLLLLVNAFVSSHSMMTMTRILARNEINLIFILLFVLIACSIVFLWKKKNLSDFITLFYKMSSRTTCSPHPQHQEVDEENRLDFSKFKFIAFYSDV